MSRILAWLKERWHAKANISAEKTPSATEARLPSPDDHSWGPGRPEGAPVQGSEAYVRLGASFSFGRGRRLTDTKRFSQVARTGRGWTTPLLVMKVSPNHLPTSRSGVSVGKRVGGAVVRNRVKRRIREAIRVTPMALGWDVVFIARSGAAAADPARLRTDVDTLLRRARLVAETTESTK